MCYKTVGLIKMYILFVVHVFHPGMWKVKILLLPFLVNVQTSKCSRFWIWPPLKTKTDFPLLQSRGRDYIIGGFMMILWQSRLWISGYIFHSESNETIREEEVTCLLESSDKDLTCISYNTATEEKGKRLLKTETGRHSPPLGSTTLLLLSRREESPYSLLSLISKLWTGCFITEYGRDNRGCPLVWAPHLLITGMALVEITRSQFFFFFFLRYLA